MENKKTIVNLRFKSSLPGNEVSKISASRKQTLKNTKGLISLFCYANEETKMIGGTFIFENIQFAHQYLDQFLAQGIGPKYGIIPVTLKIDISSLMGEIRGPDTK